MSLEESTLAVTIFGASGRTGSLLVERALRAGHQVKAFVRDPDKVTLADTRLELIQGDAKNEADVARAVEGADAVLSALGHTKTSAKDIQTVATAHIIHAMKTFGVRRLVSLTGAGVKAPEDQPKVIDRVFGLLLATFARNVIKDAEAHAELIRKSGVEYVIVRGPRLTDGAYTGSYKVGFIGKGSGTQASRADVADFMLKQLTSEAWLGRAPLVSS